MRRSGCCPRHGSRCLNSRNRRDGQAGQPVLSVPGGSGSLEAMQQLLPGWPFPANRSTRASPGLSADAWPLGHLIRCCGQACAIARSPDPQTGHEAWRSGKGQSEKRKCAKAYGLRALTKGPRALLQERRTRGKGFTGRGEPYGYGPGQKGSRTSHRVSCTQGCGKGKRAHKGRPACSRALPKLCQPTCTDPASGQKGWSERMAQGARSCWPLRQSCMSCMH